MALAARMDGADYRIGAGELAISDVEVIFAAQKHEDEQRHNGKREKMCFGLWLHGAFPRGRKAGFDACPRRVPSFVFPANSLLRNKGSLMAWFLLAETKTTPMGSAHKEFNAKSWLGGR